MLTTLSRLKQLSIYESTSQKFDIAPQKLPSGKETRLPNIKENVTNWPSLKLTAKPPEVGWLEDDSFPIEQKVYFQGIC